MAFPQVTNSRVFAALLLAAGVALLGIALKNRFANDSYDSLHSLAAYHGNSLDDTNVVIVYLDIASFFHEHQDPANRWPRDLHSRLLNRLTADGARAVVFDILFDTPSKSHSADIAFATAIKENGHVVLAAGHNNKSTHETSGNENRTRSTMLILPEESFAGATAGWGVDSLWIDDDFVVRHHLPPFGSEQIPSLSRATARLIGVTNGFPGGELWIRYYGPALTIPQVSYYEALEPGALPLGFFRDKIVFIGGRPIEGLPNSERDEFRSPFRGAWSSKELFIPGVEVHATQLLNLLRHDGLQRPANFGENLILLLSALIFGGGLLWLRPVPATVVALVGIALAPLMALAGFANGIWFPWLVVSAVQIPAALFGSWLWQFQEWFFTRRKMEAAKRIADAKIREQAALIDKAHDAILVQDLTGKIIYANPSAEKLYGWKFSEIRPESAAEMFSPAAANADKARNIAVKEGEWNGELQLQTQAGQVITVDSRWTLIRDDADQPSGLLLINSDITEKKNLEQQFLRTQRMNTIGTLAGGMAHDLNNALSPVLLGAQLLRRKTSDENDRKLLSLIETSAHRGADMVRQVLLFARGRGGEFERLELGPLVKELEKMVRETFPKNIAVETFIPRDLWPVQGNLTQLHQVLLNLCVNARDAMPDGGKLSFVADNVTLTEAEAKEIPDGQPGKFISLAVSDTGTGMPPEVKAKIFEPFFTTKGEGKGTGIGLATVIRILKSHGGFLRVESEVGQGTSFEVFIPCAPEFSVATQIKTEDALPRGNGELILVADDEQALCELIAAELTEFNYRVISAANGAEAVALFKQHAGEVRLLITDNSMPVLTGPQAIAEIRKFKPGLPVILASGEGGTGLEGVAELEKPFALAELLNAVSRSLK